MEISGNFMTLFKEHYGIGAPGSSMLKTAGLGGDMSALSKLGELSRQRVTLVSVLEEYGSQCSVSIETFRKALLGAGLRLDEEQAAGIMILVIPKSYAPEASTWNLEIVADVLNQECRGLNWTLVAKSLDTPRLSIRTEGDYQILSRLFVRISGTPIPAAGLLASLWNNRPAQFAMLMLSANSPRAIVDFAPLISQDQVLSSSAGSDAAISIPPNLSWLCVPLYVRLLDLASSGLAMEVLEVIAKAAAMYPEYVLTSLAQVQDHSGVRNELLQRLLPLFTGLPGSRSSSLLVMKKLYASNIELLLRLCCVSFRRAKKVSEVLSVENIVKSLGPQALRRLEEEGTVEELLSFWCIKADKGELGLEEKIAAVLEANPKQNARMVVNFVRQNVESLRPRFSQHSDGVLSFESCAVLIRSLQAYPAVVPLDEVKALAALFTQQQSLQQQQQMMSSLSLPALGHAAMATAATAGAGTSYARDPVREIVEAVEVTRLPPGAESEDVEAIANAYFQKIYTTDISIPEVILLMRQFKSSNEKKEQEIFRCMVHNLFDEYRFFHKYPEKELLITGRLFGALIQHQLVSSITLGIALRYVLEALRKDPEQGEGNEKMFRFGQFSLDQFRSRLGEWPQYCSHLIQIPHLSRHNLDLFQEAQRALSNPMPQQTPSQQLLQQSSSSQFSTPVSYDYGSSSGYSFQQQQQQALPPPSFPSIPQPAIPSSSLPTGPSSALSSSTGPLAPQFSGLAFGSSQASEGTSVLSGTNAPKPLVSAPSFQPSSSLLLSPPAESLHSAVAAQMQQFPATVVSAAMAKASSEGDEQQQHREIDRMQSVNKPLIDPASPPDSVRDQVQFVINNVAKNNLESKSSELKELLKPAFFPWFAAYLVEKRVSSQPNLHPLYLTMLDGFQLAELNKFILDSTYYNVTKYLSSPIITTSSNERSVLRNYGMWLGQLTLARNKPLLQRRINLKALIFWGYETGRLIAVCSFIAKVIEAAKESKVFRPPNPWLMAILGVLKELYEIQDLKLNIKFEVQALCKNINVNIDDIPKTNLLVQCRAPVKDSRNPDFNLKGSNTTGGGSNATLQPSPVQAALPANIQHAVTPLPSTATAAGVAAGAVSAQRDEVTASSTTTSPVLALDISASVVINPTLQFFANNPAQRRLVAVAVERGIREIMSAAVDRAVSIASATTKQLVTKDFATEGSEGSVRHAAHLMVSSLASSLALAICKEPLRISIGNHLRTLLASLVPDQSAVEQIVQVCSNDNIDVGSALIE
jgi:CCR4-NOT transcription complex subunit 1